MRKENADVDRPCGDSSGRAAARGPGEHRNVLMGVSWVPCPSVYPHLVRTTQPRLHVVILTRVPLRVVVLTPVPSPRLSSPPDLLSTNVERGNGR